MDNSTRLIALAHLHMGKSPTETSDIMEFVSYSQALKLKKELMIAEESSAVLQLFKLDESALEVLLDSVRAQLVPAMHEFGVGDLVENEIASLKTSIAGGKQLNLELQNAAAALANKIRQAAVISNNSDTVLQLSKALGELQTAFFGAGAHGPQQSGPNVSDFEKYLKK